MNQDPEPKENTSVEPDLFPPGSRACFIFTKEKGLTEKLVSIFESQGYYTATADDPGQGVAKLRLNRYHAAVIQHDSGNSAMLEEINSWPGNTRRGMNLMVLGGEAPSMHQSQALVLGANFYLNLRDSDTLEELIMQCLRGYELYYHPWNKVLEEMND